MSNIDNFNKITSAIFAELYEQFPITTISFSSDDLCHKISLPEHTKICKASMEFLEYEGFIRYTSSTNSGHFSHVCLTLKGLTALQKILQSVDESKVTIGESLVQKVKDNSWQVATNLATQALQSVI